MKLEVAEKVVRHWARAPLEQRRETIELLAEAIGTIGEDDPALATDLLNWAMEILARPVWKDAARPEQLRPGSPGAAIEREDWDVWLILAGRGFGKTRSGAEDTADRLKHASIRFALVAATFAAGRDDMVEGESGLLRCLPPSLLINGSVEDSWNRSQGQLKLANGSRARIFSSEKPDALRGPQHHYAWADELAKFKDANTPTTEDSTWSNLMMTMRLGRHPQVVVTGTPRPCLVLTGTRDNPEHGLLNNPNTVITRGTTYDNLANLAGTFRRRILMYEGTRLGRQELLAEVLTDIEGALWTSHLIEAARVAPGYEVGIGGGLKRIVVGVDPSVGQGHETNDECGIVIAGRSFDDHGYVLDDRSGHLSPDAWARRVVKAFWEFEADRVVAEKNNGGELVAEMIRVTDNRVPIKLVTAKRSKYLRAEPVSAMYEPKHALIHHVGIFPKLEDQMTQYVPNDASQDSPDRLDAFVYAISDLFDLGGREQPMTHSTRRGPSGRR